MEGTCIRDNACQNRGCHRNPRRIQIGPLNVLEEPDDTSKDETEILKLKIKRKHEGLISQKLKVSCGLIE